MTADTSHAPSVGSGAPSARVPVSFELFPPRSDASAIALGRTIDRLATADPQFFSVTYGASGSVRDRSLTVLSYILEHTTVPAMAHLTCVGMDHAQANSLVHEFLDAGVTSFLALRGDPPNDPSVPIGTIGTAAELVQLILRVQQEREPFGSLALPLRGAATITERSRPIRIAVAAFPSGHPKAQSRWQDVDALLAKQTAGATMALTQVLFRTDDYAEYVERARDAGVTMPIIPGLMPVDSAQRLLRVAELTDQPAPRGLRDALGDATPTDAAEIGLQHAFDLATEVLALGAPALHLYTFNRYDTVLPLIDRLDAGRRRSTTAPTDVLRRTP